MLCVICSRFAWLRKVSESISVRNQKRDHFGQVVPVEEVEQILAQVDGIARLPCVCRRVTTGQKEARYCFALTGDPRLAEVLDDTFSLEYLSPAEATEAVRELDERVKKLGPNPLKCAPEAG